LKSRRFSRTLFVQGFSCLSLVLLFWGRAEPSSPDSSASDPVYARVLEVEGGVEFKVSDEETRLLEPGDFLRLRQKLSLCLESSVTLVMKDSTVRRFNGPATLKIEGDPQKIAGSILARLGSTVVKSLFAREKAASEVAMAPRIPDGSQERVSYVPILVHPAPGSSVFEKPTQFRWRKIAGVQSYRVSVYSSNRLLWRGTSSDPYVNCPAEHCDFKYGNLYWWTVEAVIGDSALRSKTAGFEVLPEVARDEVYEAFKEVDSCISDSDLSTVIKVRLYSDLGTYDKALELINSHWNVRSFGRRACLLRAEVKEKMGLFEDAWLDYRTALRMPSEE
jgi:hypothetical protein